MHRYRTRTRSVTNKQRRVREKEERKFYKLKTGDTHSSRTTSTAKVTLQTEECPHCGFLTDAMSEYSDTFDAELLAGIISNCPSVV